MIRCGSTTENTEKLLLIKACSEHFFSITGLHSQIILTEHVQIILLSIQIWTGSFLWAVRVFFSALRVFCSVLGLTWSCWVFTPRRPQEILQLLCTDGNLLWDQPSLEVFQSTGKGDAGTVTDGKVLQKSTFSQSIHLRWKSSFRFSCGWCSISMSYLSSMSPLWKSSEVWASCRNRSQHSFLACDKERKMSLEVTSLDWPFIFFRRFSANKHKIIVFLILFSFIFKPHWHEGIPVWVSDAVFERTRGEKRNYIRPKRKWPESH